MADCGKKHAHLLVTEDGKTPSDPWSWFAGPMDYDAWYDVAHRVGREVFRQWSWLLSVEDKLAKLDDPHPAERFPRRDHLVFQLGSFEQALGELGHVLVEPVKNPEWTWEPAIRRAIAAARDGTCVLETIDEATAYYQRPPPQVPERPADPKPSRGRKTSSSRRETGGWGSTLITGALALGGALWWRRRRNNRGGGA